MIETIAFLSVAAVSVSTIINFDEQPARGSPSSADVLENQYTSQGVSFGYFNASGWVIANLAGGTYPFIQALSGNQAAHFDGEISRVIFSQPQQSLTLWIAVQSTTRFQIRTATADGNSAGFLFDGTLQSGQWQQFTINVGSPLISRVQFNTLGSDGFTPGLVRFALDDLSFTIPTASTAGALAAGGLALLRRQRR